MNRIFLLALALGLEACVPQDAAYSDVRHMVAERTRLTTTWGQAGDSPAARRRTRELLAKPLTSDAAVQVALFNSPDLQGACEQLGIARADLVHALRLPNPTVEAALRFDGDARPDIDLGLMLNLNGLLFLPSRNGVARAELSAAAASVAGTIMDHALATRVAFYRYQAAEQIIHLRRTVLLATRAAYDAAKRIHDAGNMTDLDLATQRALYEESRLAAAQAEAARVSTRERLNALMGFWGRRSSFRIVTHFQQLPKDDVSLADIEQRAVARSLDLEHTRRSFSAAAKRSNLARAEGMLPEVKAGVSAERGEGSWGVGPAIGLELPLFYQGQGQVARARAEMRQSASRYMSLGVRIRSKARELAARVRASRERALHLTTVLVPLRRHIVEQTQLQYNAMNASIFQLLLARRDQVETERVRVEALRDYWIARAELEQLLAGRLPSLDAAPGDAPPAGGSSGITH